MVSYNAVRKAAKLSEIVLILVVMEDGLVLDSIKIEEM